MSVDRPGGFPFETEPAEAHFQVTSLGFTYQDGTEALRDLTLEICKGRSVAITGPSGCGKSTLLYLLAGLRTAVAGSVQRRRSQNGAPLDVSMVFQKDTLLPWLTVGKNVALYANFRRESRKSARQVREHVQNLLSLAGLDGYEDYFPYQLSGGMRRRTQFLSAIAPLPDVLLLDEPFSSLDEPTRVVLHQDVLRISQELGMTLVLVTHDIAEAITLCDEIVVLTRRPATLFATHDVEFSASELDAFALREDPKFLELYAKVWHDLSGQVRSENADGLRGTIRGQG